MASLLALMLLILTAAAPAWAQPAAPSAPQPGTVTVAAKPEVRNVAIFVKNAAQKELDEKVRALEELVSSRISDLGFSVISRDDAVNAVASFADKGANAGKADAPGASLDAILSNQTSAVRLAQNMGADYVFTVTVSTYGKQTRSFSGNGIDTKITTFKLRASYKLLDKFLGGTLTGDTVEASKQIRGDVSLTDEPDVLNDLLDAAAVKLAASLKEKVEKNRIREVAGDASLAQLTVTCGLQGMTVPDVVKDDKGDFVLSTTVCKVEAINVTVELNGVVVGTAPGTFRVPKGLSKIRLSREGCKDWERTLAVTDGQNLVVDLQMSDEGYARWQQTTLMLQAIKAGAKLTDAEAERVRGIAQFFRQSGYKVDWRRDDKSDVKQDIKVDTTEGVKVQNQAREISIWQ